MVWSLRGVATRILGPRDFEESEVVRQLLGAQRAGVLLEVGAHHGDEGFLEFARRGWTVHAFEPDPVNRAMLEATTDRMPNVTVVGKAVADKPGTMMLYRSPESSGISSLAAFTTGHEPAGEVEVITLREYLKDGPDRVDFLKMDVEGYERFVMAGYPWDTHRPCAVLLEFEDAKTLPLGYAWRDLADDLVGHGYQVLISEWYPIVRYGVRHRWRHIRPYPDELSNDSAWGNLIAVEPADLDVVLRAARRAGWRVRLRRPVDQIWDALKGFRR